MVNFLYIHIPFCRKKCLYCDFTSFIFKQNIAQHYIDKLISQIIRIDSKFLTIYIGGGTPTILDEELLKILLVSLKKNLTNNTEFTIEANPESLTRKKLDLFLKYGVNRMSIGIQSLDDEKLRKLGRVHNAKKALDAINLANKSGFKNISGDFIFGLWNESISGWKDELNKIANLPIKHLSCYALSYERHTQLSKQVKVGKIKPLDDITVGRMYEYTINFLPKNGFKQYEVSNFAKNGFECKHNLNYWDNNEYIGLGENAVSYIKGERIKNIGTKVSKEKLSKERMARETAALKIRTKAGINKNWFKNKTGFSFNELVCDSLDYLIKNKLILNTKKRIFLTKKGFLFSDTVSSSFL